VQYSYRLLLETAACAESAATYDPGLENQGGSGGPAAAVAVAVVGVVEPVDGLAAVVAAAA
jgi:hypothetical protein